MSLLLSPFEIKGLKLKNRVVMSPRCMHSAGEDGFVTDWHRVHYGARAQGQVGLIFPETLAVHKDARIGEGDLGIWSDARSWPERAGGLAAQLRRQSGCSNWPCWS